MLARYIKANAASQLIRGTRASTQNVVRATSRQMSTEPEKVTHENRVENTISNITEDFSVEADSKYPFLDPLNPPRLTYKHLKLIKNIDYSPLVKRAREQGMFTVEDVMKVIEEVGANNNLATKKDITHKQDAYIFNETFDVFNKSQKKCPLCIPDPTPERVNRVHYTNVNLLRQYINSQGMILNRDVTGTCRKHQNMLRSSIKNARILSLLSPTSKWFVPLSYMHPEKYDGRDQPKGKLLESLERNVMFDEFARYGSETTDNFDDYVRDFNKKVKENPEEYKLRANESSDAYEPVQQF